jgi:hypothetical protein
MFSCATFFLLRQCFVLFCVARTDVGVMSLCAPSLLSVIILLLGASYQCRVVILFSCPIVMYVHLYAVGLAECVTLFPVKSRFL